METFEHKGLTFNLSLEQDCDGVLPWDEYDGHGIVSDWTTRDKRPGEFVLCSDRRSKRFYDFAATVRKARAERWDCAPYKTGTIGERAHRAAMADFKRLRAFCNDDWTYVDVVVSLEDTNLQECIGRVESDSEDYINELKIELADQIIRRMQTFTGGVN